MYISIEQKTSCLYFHYSSIGTLPSPSIVGRYCSHLLRPRMMTIYSQFFLNVAIFYNIFASCKLILKYICKYV